MNKTESTATERQWTFDRHAELPPGPWMAEPDKVQWVDAATGLDCLIKRNHLGALCGYVGVPPEHPWHGVGYSGCLLGEACTADYCYDHSPDYKVDVHGGLTYAASCEEGGGDDAICHVPFEGRTPDVWWFGFDCAHSSDVTPGMLKYGSLYSEGIYRTVDYVRAECVSLAEQLSAVPA